MADNEKLRAKIKRKLKKKREKEAEEKKKRLKEAAEEKKRRFAEAIKKKRKMVEKKTIKTTPTGIMYTFQYGDKDDNETQLPTIEYALNSLSFFVKKTLNTGWDNPNNHGISPYFIFLLESDPLGFIFPQLNNVVIIKNYGDTKNPTLANEEPSSLFTKHVRVTINTILRASSLYYGPFLPADKKKYWLASLKSLSIDELAPIFIKHNNTVPDSQINDFLNRKNPVEDVVEPIPGNHYAIYSHYDVDNVVQDYVITEVKCLHKLGYKVIFYSTSKHIINHDMVTPYTHEEAIRMVENISVGTEFKNLYNVLSTFKQESTDYDSILFVNDSLFFPLSGIASMRNTLVNMSQYDIWGHWDEYMPNSRLQFIYSCLLCFKKKVAPDILTYLEEWLPKCTNRVEFINYIEWRLPNYLKGKNHKIGTVVRFNDLKLIQPKYNKIITHSPRVIGLWMAKPETFAMKYKYILYFLNPDSVNLSPYFWYLSRNLFVGPNRINYYHREKSGLYITL